MNTEITEKFISGLRRNQKTDTHIYYNLFSILNLSDPDFLDYIYDEYKKDDEDFFRVFHKTFRQCDVFSDEKISAITRVGFTDEERLRRNELSELRKYFRREDDKRTLKPDITYENDAEYKDWGYELRRIIRKGSRILMQEENITGHLDSIFYQTIANDNKGNLYEYMRTFFKNL